MLEEALEEARERTWACVLGAAVGDALGWALDAAVAHPLIHPRQERSPVLRRFVSVEGRTGLAGDTTQLMLFTAEGVLRAHNRVASQQPADPIASVHRAWLRWLDTQRKGAPPPRPDGWLSATEQLYARRGRTTVTGQALRSGWMGTPERPINNASEGGILPRMVPIALSRGWSLPDLARGAAALTHGHPSAGFASVTVVQMLSDLIRGAAWDEVVDHVWSDLEAAGAEALPVLEALGLALEQADLGEPSAERLTAFGDGWSVESVLAIAVYACAAVRDPADASGLAVLHPGGSDWTGALAGALAGARWGRAAVRAELADDLELRGIVSQVADDLWGHFGPGPFFEPSESDWTRYPG
ncbi:MAG: ADP-ribosylglycohydrolase family protein [Alphaproteobacteria bacterium]|nr:ADP-ribosylglycohydrolase family protein [Alphaproteobacteria bacterium]MCB9697220.1 ADP-ribosylglycohydrolase family protein [Alphaproteobacteria bacterium]